MQSVLTDCPDREKGPYTGDNLHNIDTELTLFDMQAYEGQLVNNMRTAQRPVPANGQFPGMIANIAPEYHFVPPSATSGTLVPGRAQLGRRRDHGPVEPLPGLRRHQGHEASTTSRWSSGSTGRPPPRPPTTATSAASATGRPRRAPTAQPVIDYGYYRGASAMAKIAALLGKTADADKYAQLARRASRPSTTRSTCTPTPPDAPGTPTTPRPPTPSRWTPGSCPTQYRAAVVDSLVAAVRAYGNRIGTGSVAIGPLFRTLHAAGRDDVIYDMVANPASPATRSSSTAGARR